MPVSVPDLIRSACLTHFAEVARSAGLSPEHMLRRAGLPPSALTELEIRIPALAVMDLLEASAEAAGIDDFGLRLAERGGLANLGPVALVARDQPDIGAALAAIGRYIHIHNEAIRLVVQEHGGIVAVRPILVPEGAAPPRQAIELMIGVTYRILGAFLGPGWRPLDVHFAHPGPRDRAPYRRFFACNVAFSAEYDAVICARQDLARPMPAADAAMARYAQRYIDGIAARTPSMPGKVRELVNALLPTGRCSIERVAAHLGCTRRTVHRQLARHGTSYAAILDASRAEAVTRLARDEARSLQSVAELLGFSAQSALARWFRARFGQSITGWRAAAPARDQ